MSDVHVLLVEDSGADAELVALLLEETGERVRLTRAGTLTDALAALSASSFDAALADLSLAGTARPLPEPRTPAQAAPARVDPQVRDRIAELSGEGASLHTIAAVLNSQGLRNPVGRRWHARSVARTLATRTPA